MAYDPEFHEDYMRRVREDESIPLDNVHQALAYMQEVIDGFEAENKRYKDALTRIAYAAVPAHMRVEYMETQAKIALTGKTT